MQQSQNLIFIFQMLSTDTFLYLAVLVSVCYFISGYFITNQKSAEVKPE